jgi:FMN phosphatase YigB (HAD superfamily)
MQLNANILNPETRLVIFDLDGTLYTKPCMVWHMLASAPSDWRLMWAERKTRKQLRGKWLENERIFYQTYFQIMASFCSLSPNQMREWYMNSYMPLMVNVIRKYYKPSEWLLPFIAECKQRGIRLVILSDYGHTLEKLEALGIDKNLFDWVVSAPELGGLKPAPQLIDKVIEFMGVARGQCLIIGDRNDTDGQLANDAGAAFCLV